MRRNGFYPAAIIDVGAYQGEWSRMARRIYADAPIYMFEANAQKEPILSRVIAEIGRARYRIGLLGPRAAESVPFYLMETGSSVLPENTSLPRTTARLAMATLDQLLFAGEPIPGPYFLKLDVQGFELEILRGAARVLEDTEAALLEVSLLEYNQGAPLLAEVVAFMQSRGLVVYDISGFFRRESDDTLYMVDLLFVRETSALRSKKRFWNREAEFEEQPVLR
jgi:FkbM family methyltransferase